MNGHTFLDDITDELIANEIIKFKYQTSIILYNYEKNQNKYHILFKDNDFTNIPVESVKNPIKRINKIIEQIQNKIAGRKIDSTIVLELMSLVTPDKDMDKYIKLVGGLKNNEFFNPITTSFILEKIESPEKYLFFDDIYNNPTYTDEWFYSNILKSSYITWTMGCLIEKSYFNVRKNDLYVNIFINDEIDDIEDKNIAILGIFIENTKTNRDNLSNYINSNAKLQRELFSEDIVNIVKLNTTVPRNKVENIDNLLNKMLRTHLFTAYTEKYIKFSENIISPYLSGTRDEATRVKPILDELLKENFITIPSLNDFIKSQYKNYKNY